MLPGASATFLLGFSVDLGSGFLQVPALFLDYPQRSSGTNFERHIRFRVYLQLRPVFGASCSGL